MILKSCLNLLPILHYYFLCMHTTAFIRNKTHNSQLNLYMATSFRTLVYPIAFVVVHFLAQLLAAVIVSISYMSGDSFSFLWTRIRKMPLNKLFYAIVLNLGSTENQGAQDETNAYRCNAAY